MPEPLTIMWSYPWDLWDEGIEPSLATVRREAKATEVGIAVAYHSGTYFLPHNPRRQFYYGEDGSVFFQPEPARYQQTHLRPRVSEVIDGPDYLPTLVSRVRARGLGFTAWVVYNYNHYLGRTFPECAKVDALGNRYLDQLCAANPDVRAYQRALTSDVAANCRPDYVFVESPGFVPYDYGWPTPMAATAISPRCGFLLGLCFCSHCVGAARAVGVDGERIKTNVANYLRRALPELPPPQPPPAGESWLSSAFDGELAQFLQVREEVAAAAYEAIAAVCRAHGVQVFGFVPATGREDGALHRVLPLLDRGLVQAGAGASNEAVARARARLKPQAAVIAHGHAGSHATEQEFVAQMLACRDAGADGFGCYNYGLVRPAHLQWVGTAAAAGQQAERP